VSSRSGSEPLDLERLVTTPADVLAQRGARAARPLTTPEYLRALARLPQPSAQELRGRRGPRGEEPFRL
jgi:hypothetical protein